MLAEPIERIFFERYDAYLSSVRSEFDNYWSDIGMSEASELLDQFTINDWGQLKEVIYARPTLWQVSCAETLSEISNKRQAIEFLLALIRVENEAVTVAALDSVNALISYGLDDIPDVDLLRSSIEKTRMKGGKLVDILLNSLEGKLSKM